MGPYSMDPLSVGDSSLSYVLSSAHFPCIVLYGMTIPHIIVFIHSAVDGHVLLCKLAPLQGWQGETEERGRPLQIGRWQV